MGYVSFREGIWLTKSSNFLQGTKILPRTFPSFYAVPWAANMSVRGQHVNCVVWHQYIFDNVQGIFFEALWKCVKHPWFFFNTKGWVIYLEPKWPLFWLEKTLNLEGPRLKIEDKQVHIFFIFIPIWVYLGKWSNLTNIFQMGWNHQLVYKHDFISYEFPRFPSWTFLRNLLGGSPQDL